VIQPNSPCVGRWLGTREDALDGGVAFFVADAGDRPARFASRRRPFFARGRRALAFRDGRRVGRDVFLFFFMERNGGGGRGTNIVVACGIRKNDPASLPRRVPHASVRPRRGSYI
jgi:hypothetical protein